jgi:hypothetical protein
LDAREQEIAERGCHSHASQHRWGVSLPHGQAAGKLRPVAAGAVDRLQKDVERYARPTQWAKRQKFAVTLQFDTGEPV